MEKLILKKKTDTPAIVFIPDKGVFQITGECWPENASKFCKPIFDWLNEYFNNTPLPITNFEMRLEYYNTSAQKQLMIFFHFLKKQSKLHPIKIFWYYRIYDEDAKEEAERYQKLMGLDDFLEIIAINKETDEIGQEE